MRFFVTLFACALLLTLVACADDDDEERALALGPGGEPCDLVPLDAERARVVCAGDEEAVVYLR